MNKLLPFLCSLALAALAFSAQAQAPAERVLVASPAVGEVIDGAEKARFGLFPTYAADDFQDAKFVRALAPDSAITLRIRLRDGRQVDRATALFEFQGVRDIIERRLREVGTPVPTAAPVGARAAPVPGVAPTSTLPVASGTTPEIVGRSYSVELRSGNSFIGVLRAATSEELEFETKDLGSVRVQRTNLKDFVLLSAEQARRGYDDVGNGNRLFFAPTARNLRRGEGYVQSQEIFLLSVNYGVTDNFSMGALATVFPAAGSDNFIGLTPKLSFPLAEKVHVGAGALVLFANGGTGGVTYANATYGSADHNLTAGVGYGFAGGIGFSSTPVLVLGGATRVSRRFSLLNETYILRERNSNSTAALVAGIVGVRVAGPRISGGLGLVYAIISYDDSQFSSDVNNSGVYPFAELTVRFGKKK